MNDRLVRVVRASDVARGDRVFSFGQVVRKRAEEGSDRIILVFENARRWTVKPDAKIYVDR